MQLKLKRSQQGRKFLLEVRAEFTPEEQTRVAEIPYYDILHVVRDAGARDVTKRSGLFKAAVTGFFPELKSDAIYISAKSIQRGHVIEADYLEAITEVESKIRNGCKTLQTHLDVRGSFTGEEQVIDLAEEGRVVARAVPPPERDD